MFSGGAILVLHCKWTSSWKDLFSNGLKWMVNPSNRLQDRNSCYTSTRAHMQRLHQRKNQPLDKWSTKMMKQGGDRDMCWGASSRMTCLQWPPRRLSCRNLFMGRSIRFTKVDTLTARIRAEYSETHSGSDYVHRRVKFGQLHRG